MPRRHEGVAGNDTEQWTLLPTGDSSVARLQWGTSASRCSICSRETRNPYFLKVTSPQSNLKHPVIQSYGAQIKQVCKPDGREEENRLYGFYMQ